MTSIMSTTQTKKMHFSKSKSKIHCQTKTENIMNSMSEQEIDTLINLLRWLENRGSIIIVENNIAEIHNEIRQFNPNADVHSTYQSLNPSELCNDVPIVPIVPKTEGFEEVDPLSLRLENSTQTKPKFPKKRGRKRLTMTAKKTAKRKKQEQDELELALAEATRGTYIGKPPKPKLSTILLLRRKYRPPLKCTITDVPKIQPAVTTTPIPDPVPGVVKPAESEPPPETIQNYICDICNKVLKTKSSLRSHKNTHSSKSETICEKCGKTFKHSRGLKRHLIAHEGDRKFLCEHCPASFIFQQKLKEHTMSHTGEKRFHCSTCSRAFKTKKHLQTHQVVHSEQRPFVCNFCSKSFRRISHLHQHVRIHTGVKPFKCELCGKAFVQQTSLQCHTKSHHQGQGQEIPAAAEDAQIVEMGLPPSQWKEMGHTNNVEIDQQSGSVHPGQRQPEVAGTTVPISSTSDLNLNLNQYVAKKSAPTFLT